MKHNIVAATDSYKLLHYAMMVDGTQGSFSNFTPRVGGLFKRVLWNGLQPLLMDYLQGEVVTREGVEEMRDLQAWHMPGTRFNAEGWDYILRRHGGRLPVRICAAPEGLIIPAGNVLMTVENTEQDEVGGRLTAFLPDYIESLLSKVWYPTMIGSLTWHVLRGLEGQLRRSGCDVAWARYMLHNFGYRASSTEESAAKGGVAHLINFDGTDDLLALLAARHYYGARGAATSVPAPQHSIMTAGGPGREIQQALNIIQRNEGQVVSMVADSYDYEHFVAAMVDAHEQVLARRVNLVIRPDSVTARLPTPQAVVLWTLGYLADHLPSTTTPTGHRRVAYKVIYADGLHYRKHSVDEVTLVTKAAVDAGYAADNLLFGMGDGMMQDVGRDDARCAYKASAVWYDGAWHDIFKQTGWKSSKGGRLGLYYNTQTGEYTTQDERVPTLSEPVLRPVLQDGVILRQQAWSDVLHNARDLVNVHREDLELATA